MRLGPCGRPWQPPGGTPPVITICVVVGAVLAFALTYALPKMTGLHELEARLIGLGVVFVAVVLGVWLQTRNRFG